MAAGAFTFDDGATSITVNGQVFPEQPMASRPVLWGMTMGGAIKCVDLGGTANWQQPVIHINKMSNTDYESVRDFIIVTVDGAEVAFSYTDPFSVVRGNCHYLGGLETFRRNRGNLWSGTIRLHQDTT